MKTCRVCLVEKSTDEFYVIKKVYFSSYCKPCSIQKTQERAATHRLAPGDPRHGTRNGYANYGCDCRDCVKANAEWSATWKAKHPERVKEYRKAAKRRSEAAA